MLDLKANHSSLETLCVRLGEAERDTLIGKPVATVLAEPGRFPPEAVESFAQGLKDCRQVLGRLLKEPEASLVEAGQERVMAVVAFVAGHEPLPWKGLRPQSAAQNLGRALAAQAVLEIAEVVLTLDVEQDAVLPSYARPADAGPSLSA